MALAWDHMKGWAELEAQTQIPNNKVTYFMVGNFGYLNEKLFNWSLNKVLAGLCLYMQKYNIYGK